MKSPSKKIDAHKAIAVYCIRQTKQQKSRSKEARFHERFSSSRPRMHSECNLRKFFLRFFWLNKILTAFLCCDTLFLFISIFAYFFALILMRFFYIYFCTFLLFKSSKLATILQNNRLYFCAAPTKLLNFSMPKSTPKRFKALIALLIINKNLLNHSDLCATTTHSFNSMQVNETLNYQNRNINKSDSVLTTDRTN